VFQPCCSKPFSGRAAGGRSGVHRVLAGPLTCSTCICGDGLFYCMMARTAQSKLACWCVRRGIWAPSGYGFCRLQYNYMSMSSCFLGEGTSETFFQDSLFFADTLVGVCMFAAQHTIRRRIAHESLFVCHINLLSTPYACRGLSLKLCRSGTVSLIIIYVPAHFAR